ncbi:hypothetical protein CMO94_03830 [Candidatus Woesearchaeota archaeon]|jgi:hypothetical protein|nr:hypothetical protein [Candidatus Woesearchaeota archaeon]
MDIFEWVFKKRPGEKYILEVDSLKKTIKPEIKLFDDLWLKHKEKRALLRKIQEGKSSLSKRIPGLNRDILKYFRKILYEDNNINALIKKIIFESTERLHEAESWVRRYGEETPPTWEEEYGQVVGPKGTQRKTGIRRPYYIEQAKRSVLDKVKDEKKLEEFIRAIATKLSYHFNILKDLYPKLEQILNSQSEKAKQRTIDVEEFTGEEDDTLLEIRKVLMDILNEIILFARKTTLLEFDEQKIIQSLHSIEPSSKRIGIMFIHGVLCKPEDFYEFENSFHRKGFITYNVRLPGHGITIDDLLTTPLGQIESFLI